MILENITDIVFEDIDHNDYPDYCDAHIVSAKCNGIDLDDNEIDQLNEDRDWLYDKLMDYIF